MNKLLHLLAILKNARFFRFLLIIVLVFTLSALSFCWVEYDAALKGESGFTTKLGLSFWWAIVTSSTVGYGDYYPQTAAGRTVAVIVMVLGITFFGVITASLTTFIVEQRQREAKGLDPVTLSDHIVVCGWNSYGLQIVEELRKEGNSLVILAELEEKPDVNEGILFVHGSPTSQQDQLKACIDKARIAMFLSDISGGKDFFQADANTILAVLNVESLCSKLGHEIYTCAELVEEENLHHLKNAGVDEVVIHGFLTAGLLSQSARHPGFSKIINDLVNNDFGKEITRVAVIDYPEFKEGITSIELLMELKKNHGITLIAIQEPNGEMEINPNHDKIVKKEHLLYIIRNC
jgi:voltage-gated potassium channel